MSRPATFQAAIRRHWADPAPGWVVALARSADALGLAAAGAAIGGYSKTAVSLALRNRYPGGLTTLAAAVTRALPDADPAPVCPAPVCPVLGPVSLERCREAAALARHTHTLLAGMLRLACPSCPHHHPPTPPTSEA